MRWKRKWLPGLLALLLLFFYTECTMAAVNDPGEQLTDEIDWSSVDALVNTESDGQITFSELVKNLMQDGFGTEGFRQIGTWLSDSLTGEITANKKLLLEVILLAFCFSVLKNFTGTLGTSYISELSFLLLYCVLSVLLLQTFFSLQGIVQDTLLKCVDFMKAFIPAFCASMIFSSNVSSSAGFYQLAFLVVYLMEWLFLKVFLPLVHIYVLLEVLSHFLPEEHFSNLTELFYEGIDWGIRLSGIAVLGLSVVQNLISSAKDRVAQSALTKTAAAIPGIGDVFGGIAEVMLGSGMLIKNCVGVAGLAVLVILCIIPLLKAVCLVFFYRIAAAVTEPVADKRICGCLKGMAHGGVLYLKLLSYCVALFFLTVALTAAASGFAF